MKRILLSIIFISICLYTNAQTYFSPFIGFDMAKLENRYKGRDKNYTLILEKGYKIQSVSVGGMITHMISKDAFISLASRYSHQNVSAESIGNFIDVRGIKYNYFQNHLSFGYAFPGFYMGTGYSYNFIGNLKYSFQTVGATYNSSEHGLIFYIGKEVSNFDFQLHYYQGLSSINIKSFSFYLEPISSFGLTMGYQLKIADGGSKEADCPKF